MRPLALALALAAPLLFATPTAQAQTINPDNMVSGTDSVLFSEGKDFYTVPPNQVFVLTDFAAQGAVTLNLLDDGALRFARYVQDGGFSLGTGIVFHSGHKLGLFNGAVGYGGYQHFSWSGYLTDIVVGVAPSDQPDERLGFRLGPNPSGGETVELRFELGKPADVSLRIYDVQGRLVTTLADARLPAGRHDLTWTGKNTSGEPVAAGVYFARLESSKANSVRRLVRVR